MKKMTHFFLALFLCCLPTLLQAQDDDSKYLTGAVPEVDGKVVFTKEFSIPGMSQDEIFKRIYDWMEKKLKENKNNSRIVFSDKEKGQIVGTGDEWIVFSSSALSLDRTKILYQLTVNCQLEKCTLQIEKIRFSYREGKEKYTAEEWITDKYALNKAQTKLVRGLAKWRRKTVDFANNMALEVTEALSASSVKAPVKEETSEKTSDKTGPIVITSKQQVNVETPKVSTAQTQPATVVIPATPITQSATTSQASAYKQVTPDQLPANAIQSGAGKLVIVIGEEPFNMTMMTANSGGSLGKVNGKSVIFSILSPDQPYEQMEKAEKYLIRFYPTGATEPTVILDCKKLPSPAAMEGMPRTYVGEIVKAMIK